MIYLSMGRECSYFIKNESAWIAIGFLASLNIILLIYSVSIFGAELVKAYMFIDAVLYGGRVGAIHCEDDTAKGEEHNDDIRRRKIVWERALYHRYSNQRIFPCLVIFD